MGKKKKTSSSAEALLNYDDMNETEWCALCLTHYIVVLQPSLEEARVYESVYSLLMEHELSPEVAEEHGEILRATLEMPRDANVH